MKATHPAQRGNGARQQATPDLAPAPRVISESGPSLIVRGVRQTPAEVWTTMLRFSPISPAEQDAMRQTVDALFQHGYPMVVATYDHLQRFPDTAAILGWQEGADEAHLAERRRFFTQWLGRSLSMDMGTQFGDYLFYAGKVHAAHGPRHIETPSMWITGSIGLLISAFAQVIQAHTTLKAEAVGLALSGWNKYLLAQLNQMHYGYDIGKALHEGAHELKVRAYAMVRHRWGREQISLRFHSGESVARMLARLLSYAPELRDILFEPCWESEEREDELWVHVERHYVLRQGWRVQLNGKNLTFHGGFEQPLQPGDEITLFSPGR